MTDTVEKIVLENLEQGTAIRTSTIEEVQVEGMLTGEPGTDKAPTSSGQAEVPNTNGNPASAKPMANARTRANGNGEDKPMDVDSNQQNAGVEVESDATKEGKPAEVGEKRERPITEEGKDNQAARESVLVDIEKETGKGVKKAKTARSVAVAKADQSAEPASENPSASAEQADTTEKPTTTRKKGPGRPPKSKPAAAADGKKRPVGRPRKGTALASKGKEGEGKGDEVVKERKEQTTAEETSHKHNTRSRA